MDNNNENRDDFNFTVLTSLSTSFGSSLFKRPLINAHEDERPKQKSPRLEIQPDEDEAEPIDELLHCETGVIKGMHHCSCGEAYKKLCKLQKHIEQHSGVSKYPCLRCPETFARKETLRRHEKTIHQGDKIACPGCPQLLRADYLKDHLRKPSRESCKAEAKAIYLRMNNMNGSNDRLPVDKVWISDVVEQLVRNSRPCVPNPERIDDPSTDTDSSAKPVAEPGPSARRLSTYSRSREPCNICGMALGPNKKELIEHIDKHRKEFREKPYGCLECQITFAYEKDLKMHLTAASNGDCGFPFSHNPYESGPAHLRCTGHHPPLYSKRALASNHDLMQGMLWEWEHSQLRTHRTHINRLLAAHKQCPSVTRSSMPEYDAKCTQMLSRLSFESVRSFRSVPFGLQYQDKMDADEPPVDLDRDLISFDPFFESEDFHREESPYARPDSALLGRDVLVP